MIARLPYGATRGETPASSHRRLSPLVALTVLLAALAPGVTACSTDAVGLIAPVLWGSESDGTSKGGVEPAVVVVTPGTGGFEVDLATEQAQGAGPQWVAASGSAAAVATLLSSVDPRTIDIRFEVSGPIDGPSGGAMLTVAVLAAIRGLELREGVTMTGTIGPDGSVGRVGLVPTKVRAAADAGYTLVLVPAANATDVDSSTGLDVVALGDSLGIEVQPVANLGEAVAAFTGGPITLGPPGSPPLRAPVATVATSTAAAMVNRLESALGTTAVSEGVRDATAERLAVSMAALAQGDAASAYGAATEGWLRLVRAEAREAAVAAATVDPLGTRARLVSDASAIATEADAALIRGSDTAGMSDTQVLSLPAALGWLTYALAVAEAAGEAAPGATGPAELGALAGTLAEQRAAVTVMWPDAFAVIGSLQSDAATTTTSPDGLLEGYVTLLVNAGEANQRYVESVLSTRNSSATSQVASSAANRLGARANSAGPVVARASAAMSMWFITSQQVAGAQAFGLYQFGIGDTVGTPRDQTTLDAAVRDAAETVDAASGTLAERGIDPGSPLWSASWGEAAAVADLGGTTADGEVIALGELWYSAVTTFILLAASAPGS